MDIQKIRDLYAAARPTPWHLVSTATKSTYSKDWAELESVTTPGVGITRVSSFTSTKDGETECIHGVYIHPASAELILELVNNAPELITAYENEAKLREENARLKERIRQM